MGRSVDAVAGGSLVIVGAGIDRDATIRCVSVLWVECRVRVGMTEELRLPPLVLRVTTGRVDDMPNVRARNDHTIQESG